MSLREEMWRYEQLTGESAEHIPIIKIGAFLDGVDKGIEELEKIKEEIKDLDLGYFDEDYRAGIARGIMEFNKILNKRIAELKGEQIKTNKEEITDAIKQIKEEAKDAANGKAEYMTMEEAFKEDYELKGEKNE